MEPNEKLLVVVCGSAKIGSENLSCPLPEGSPPAFPAEMNEDLYSKRRPSAESSGRVRFVSPAGLVYAAVASSARPRNAPPRLRLRAPGLEKLNWMPELISALDWA